MKSENIQLPRLVIVSGRPGSGKTTLSQKLSVALPCPLVSRDQIYEGALHTLATVADAEHKKRAAEVAFEAFFSTIAGLVTRGVMLVAEAAFQDHRWRPGLDPLGSLADIRVIHCELDAESCRTRVYERRLAEQNARRSRQEPHRATELARIPEFRHFEPLSLPVPTLNVQTASGYDPSFDQIMAFAFS